MCVRFGLKLSHANLLFDDGSGTLIRRGKANPAKKRYKGKGVRQTRVVVICMFIVFGYFGSCNSIMFRMYYIFRV